MENEGDMARNPAGFFLTNGVSVSDFLFTFTSHYGEIYFIKKSLSA
jgi:hypothetical protein